MVHCRGIDIETVGEVDLIFLFFFSWLFLFRGCFFLSFLLYIRTSKLLFGNGYGTLLELHYFWTVIPHLNND